MLGHLEVNYSSLRNSAPGNQNSSTRSRFYAILLSKVENMHSHKASFSGVPLGRPSQEKIDVDSQQDVLLGRVEP